LVQVTCDAAILHFDGAVLILVEDACIRTAPSFSPHIPLPTTTHSFLSMSSEEIPTVELQEDVLQCGSVQNETTFFGLRVASIFVILVTSSFGALFPVIAKRNPWLAVPKSAYK